MRRAQRVTPEDSATRYPSPGDEASPEELLSRPFSTTPPPSGTTSPNVRRAQPVSPAQIGRPPEPVGPKDDATTIRLSPSTGGQPSTTPDELQLDIANNLYARKQFAQAAPEYWDVAYNFRGVEHRVQMTTAPGRTITVNGKGEPRV